MAHMSIGHEQGVNPDRQNGLPEACSAVDENGRIIPGLKSQYNEAVAEHIEDPEEAKEHQIRPGAMSSLQFATCLGCLGTLGDGLGLPPECYALARSHPAAHVPQPRPASN